MASDGHSTFPYVKSQNKYLWFQPVVHDMSLDLYPGFSYPHITEM